MKLGFDLPCAFGEGMFENNGLIQAYSPAAGAICRGPMLFFFKT